MLQETSDGGLSVIVPMSVFENMSMTLSKPGFAIQAIAINLVEKSLDCKRPAPPPVVFIRVHATLRLLGGIPDGKKTWAGLLAEAP